ncbi:uncharacterized protein G2W53_008159 [Senna tora]|uniref:Uncharacterized protein n=1 Tax=Senna tora TaxID=362788 RepID=A0A834X7X4_9FABA|nr:uncharacterized protein G2W53_008159 [Senna tora]
MSLFTSLDENVEAIVDTNDKHVEDILVVMFDSPTFDSSQTQQLVVGVHEIGLVLTAGLETQDGQYCNAFIDVYSSESVFFGEEICTRKFLDVMGVHINIIKASIEFEAMQEEAKEMLVEAKTISDLVFDPSGATNILLLATKKLSLPIELCVTLNEPSLCFWKFCHLELKEHIGNFIDLYSEDASKVFDEIVINNSLLSCPIISWFPNDNVFHGDEFKQDGVLAPLIKEMQFEDLWASYIPKNGVKECFVRSVAKVALSMIMFFQGLEDRVVTSLSSSKSLLGKG